MQQSFFIPVMRALLVPKLIRQLILDTTMDKKKFRQESASDELFSFLMNIIMTRLIFGVKIEDSIGK